MEFHKYIDPFGQSGDLGRVGEKFMCVYYDIAPLRRSAGHCATENDSDRLGVVDIFSYDSLRPDTGFHCLYPGAENMVFKLNAPVLDPNCIRRRAPRYGNFVVPRKIDAIIFQKDVFAVALLSILPGYGIRVPDDLAIIGQDNDFFGRCVTPALTTIDTNITQLARTIVDTLHELIENPEKERSSIAIPTTLITRETC